MDSITLQNYRCFGSEEQTARLAPLTLLVGPNSTGKTSFLALIRALWDVAFREVVPNFREEPFDLGSFGEIVHRGAQRGHAAESFAAEFEYAYVKTQSNTMHFRTGFQPLDGFPFPALRTVAQNDREITIDSTESGTDFVRFRSGDMVDRRPWPGRRAQSLSLLPFRWFSDMSIEWGHTEGEHWNIDLGSLIFEPLIGPFVAERHRVARPFAMSPVRSRPERTYDPVLLTQDPEGDYVPSYLASLARREADQWHALKGRLEKFGSISGLFDEITVRSFGSSPGDPFQIHVRKYSHIRSSRPRKGPWRNLIDMGYGVSQALPILTELLRAGRESVVLLQQPEVHLHPQAQAALGTLFCNVAAGGRQLVVETHSDYIIDRVRMDVRDGKTDLKPEDVSILYFEPRDLDVKIHSIRLDEMGNVLDAPPGYRKFFMEEMRRSIGL